MTTSIRSFITRFETDIVK